MLLHTDFAIKILFSIVCLSSMGNDDMSMNAEHGFVPSLATNNIVSDVNQGQSKHQNSITDSFAGNCPLYFNTSKQCFSTLKKNNSSFELYNLTEEAKKLNLTAERENLRAFAETSCVNNEINGFDKALQAFFKETINYIYSLTKSQKSWIALSYLLVLCKYYGATPRSKRRALPTKYKISFTDGADIPTIPSERIIVVQNDIAHDEHVNTDKLSTSCDRRTESDNVTTNSSCDEHVNTDELSITWSCDSCVESDDVTTDSSCDKHVNTDNEIIDLSCDSLVKADEEVAAATNDISCDEYVDTDNESIDLSCDSHVNVDRITPDETYDSHVDSDDDSTATSVENLPSFIKIPPNKLELCETECGEIGLIVDPEYWDWLDLRNSSQQSLTSDDGGSTGKESRQSSLVACDVDNRTSHSSYHTPVPEKVVSCFSYSSDDSVLVNSDGGDFDSFNHATSRCSAYDELFDYSDTNSGNYDDFYPTQSMCSDHDERPEWILEYGDSDGYNHTQCDGGSVNYGDESFSNSLDDYDVMREGYEELTSAFSVALSNFVNHLDECSEYGNVSQQSVSESDIHFEVENYIQLDNQAVADEVEHVQEDTMEMTLKKRVKNHVVATAIFAGAFVLPCFIVAKLLK